MSRRFRRMDRARGVSLRGQIVGCVAILTCGWLGILGIWVWDPLGLVLAAFQP